MPKNFGKRDWETLIRHIAGNSGNVFFTRHAEQRMKQRHITRSQVLETLRLGVLRLEPEPDLKTGDVRCRMERLIAGRKIGAVLAVDGPDASSGVVVTALVIGE